MCTLTINDGHYVMLQVMLSKVHIKFVVTVLTGLLDFTIHYHVLHLKGSSTLSSTLEKSMNIHCYQ